MKKENMSIEKAIKEIVEENNGCIECIYSTKLKTLIYKKYREHGQNNKPMDTTILRSLRKFRTKGYFVHCIDKKKSAYRIEKFNKEGYLSGN